MKGVVLAGGLGTGLLPLTKVMNKHLLPIYDRRMIYDPIHTLVNAGVMEIMPVTDWNNAGVLLWTDAGTIESLHLHNQLVSQTGANKMDRIER